MCNSLPCHPFFGRPAAHPGILRKTKLDGETKQTGTLGPGTFAVIDNSTGVIEFAFFEVDFQIIERATSLTSEFSTLAASNFFGFEEFDEKFN